jgi:hypothetical protein
MTAIISKLDEPTLALHERCSWHRCRQPLVAIRSTRRFCSTRCRVARHRARDYARRLRTCSVEPVGRREARRFILRFELLGSTGNASTYFGLRDPAGQLLGAVGFGHGPHAAGGDAVLERGATRRRAPRNAASYLIGRALRYGRRVLGWTTVKAFSDPRFGEEGRVYRAAGFTPAPPSRHRDRWRYALVVGGQVFSDRAIYRRFGSHSAARAAGAELIRVPARVAWEWRA